MRAMGKRSMSSLLIVVLNALWYAVAIVLAITVALLFAGATVGLHIDSDGASVEAGPKAVMSIPVTVEVDAGTHRVTAPSLGIDDGQLSKLGGSLRFPARKGPRKPNLDEMGPGVESIPHRGRSTLGKPGMRGGFKRKGR